MNITAVGIAAKFMGLSEVAGAVHNPQIMAMLRTDNAWPDADEVPWCSAFVNYICWLISLPRSKSLRARSWLSVGQQIDIDSAMVGFDIVIFKRGKDPQPGPEVIEAPGHVGFYYGHTEDQVVILGGNQGDSVSVAKYPISSVLGVRRLC